MKKSINKTEKISFNPSFYQTELLYFAPEDDEEVVRAITGGGYSPLKIEECDLLFVVGAIHRKDQPHFNNLIKRMLTPNYIVHIQAPHLDFNPEHWLAIDEIVNVDVVVSSAYPYQSDYLQAIAKLKEKVASND